MRKIRYLIIFLIVFLVNIINCYAQPTTYDRNKLPNYGVNKQVDASNNSLIMQTPAVDAKEKIYDFTNNISDDDEKRLINKINEFSEKNKIDFIILIDNNYYPDEIKKLCDSQMKYTEFGRYDQKHVNAFYDYNDFGIDYPNYSGIVLFKNSVPNPCDGIYYYAIYTYGDANKYLTNANVNSLLEDFLPYISEKKYYEGITNMLYQIEKYKEFNIENSGIKENIITIKEVEFPWKLIVFDFILSLIIVGILVKKNIMIAEEKQAINYVKRGSLKITNKRDRVIIY